MFHHFKPFPYLYTQSIHPPFFFSPAPTLAFVSAYIQIRIDGWRLCQAHRRPQPKTAEDMGEHNTQSTFIVCFLSYLSFIYLHLLFFLLLHFAQSTLLYHILPYLTLPYLTLPYLTLPYLTLPYLTLPYLYFLCFTLLT